MADAVAVEAVERSRPYSLKALEGKTYSNLPEEVKIGDSGILEGLIRLKDLTRESDTEWSGFITKDLLGNLTLGHILKEEKMMQLLWT